MLAATVLVTLYALGWSAPVNPNAIAPVTPITPVVFDALSTPEEIVREVKRANVSRDEIRMNSMEERDVVEDDASSLPEFTANLSSQAKAEFLGLVLNSTLSALSLHEKLSQWAQKNGVENEVTEFEKNNTLKLNETLNTFEGAVSALPNALGKVREVITNQETPLVSIQQQLTNLLGTFSNQLQNVVFSLLSTASPPSSTPSPAPPANDDPLSQVFADFNSASSSNSSEIVA